MFKLERLDIWKRAIEYADDIYVLTRSFPKEERFGLISQLRRSSVSISSNIAEGISRSSDADLGRFLEITHGSLLESVSELVITQKQQFLNEEDFQRAYERAENLSKMLSGFRRTLKENSEPSALNFKLTR